MRAAPRERRRPPLPWLALIALVAALAIGTRRFASRLPGFVAAYAGDTLWATTAFLGIGLLATRATTRRVAVLVLLVSLLVEISQLSEAPWLVTIRSTTLGGLALGHGFLWSDLACYAVGVCLGILIDRVALHERPVPKGRRP